MFRFIGTVHFESTLNEAFAQFLAYNRDYLTVRKNGFGEDPTLDDYQNSMATRDMAGVHNDTRGDPVKRTYVEIERSHRYTKIFIRTFRIRKKTKKGTLS